MQLPKRVIRQLVPPSEKNKKREKKSKMKRKEERIKEKEKRKERQALSPRQERRHLVLVIAGS